MEVETIKNRWWLRPLGGGILAVCCGLFLWNAPPGEWWVNASYDYLFRFGSHAVTNQISVILMDNEAYDFFHQRREDPWDRDLHAQLLQKLAQDGCAMVVFDSFFRSPRDAASDQALAQALASQKRVVLMAQQAQIIHPEVAGGEPVLPCEPFLSAAKTNWGVAWLDPDLDSTVRRHWPFPEPGPYSSLAWKAAHLSGATLPEKPTERWLRYYGPKGAWTRLGYRVALMQPADYFRNKIVFIGTQPKTSVLDGEPDEFQTPYSRWTGETVGGVEIILTEFLNLVNDDGLERPQPWVEALTLVVVGALLGIILCVISPLRACTLTLVIAVVISLGAATWSFITRYWSPWLVITGGQLPCALGWALATQWMCRSQKVSEPVTPQYTPVIHVSDTPVEVALPEALPETPDYELIRTPFGEGAYGKVWLARNAIGQWQALKVVYLAKFDYDPVPYEREFNGIRRYKPVSDKHPSLLRIDFVSKKRPDYFYYVMELGDALDAGWEKEPSTYKPRDLVNASLRAKGKRLPIAECLRIGIDLSKALEFLHLKGLTHRDIKPRNIIYVNGQPKLADIGLIAEIKPPGQQTTYVGTPAYLPPPPERAGTPQADIYALGMVLYVLSSGHNPATFPQIATTLAESNNIENFLPLNQVIRKACHPDCEKRYASAAEMLRDLKKARSVLKLPFS